MPVTAITVVALAVATRHVYQLVTDPAVLALWWIGLAMLSLHVYAHLRADRVRRRPMAMGRTVAIVATHEHETADLHACIWSILNQRGAVVEEVHVVDVGSTDRPVQPFAHPRIRWHRTRIGGRAATGYILDRLEPDGWDFVLIADGDCVLDQRAVERQLRAFSRARVTATIPLMIARNFRQNLFTRIADLNLSASSALPALLPAINAGTPILYRARIAFQHRHRRLASDGYDVNGRLAMFAAAEGEVVEVSRATASTPAPTDIGTAYRRRVEWSASWWRAILPGLTVADRHPPAARWLFGLIQLVIAPLTIGCAVISLAMSEWRGTLRWPVITLFAALYLLVRYAATAPYLAGRRRRPWMWFLLTPTAAFWHLVVIVPVRYITLIRLCFRGGAAWHNSGTMSYPESMAQPGTIYYSGYLPDGRES